MNRQRKGAETFLRESTKRNGSVFMSVYLKQPLVSLMSIKKELICIATKLFQSPPKKKTKEDQFNFTSHNKNIRVHQD